MRAFFACVIALAVGACSAQSEPTPSRTDQVQPDPPAPRFVDAQYPERLADWGQLAVGGQTLVLGDDVIPYNLNTPLFTDYALKLRTVWLPNGAAQYQPREVFDFPTGTVITKTFYYPKTSGGFQNVSRDGQSMDHFDGHVLDLQSVRLIETRLLVRRDTGWQALPYVWNEEQTEARLARIGAQVPLTLVGQGRNDEAINYFVPNVNQCANCHESNTADGLGVRPIGPKARHLNSEFDYFDQTANQLAYWRDAGVLDGMPDLASIPAAFQYAAHRPVTLAELDAAARAYIDINCAHCHARNGQADTSALYLEPDEPLDANFGVCKPPIAAGRGTGNRQYVLVPGEAEASIFVYRMDSTIADVMMPELGRSSVDQHGVELIARWIDEMPVSCG